VPTLSDRCRDSNQYCCVCEQNKCSVALPGEVVLFVDGEEVVAAGERCDCIAVIKRVRDTGEEATYQLEIYAVELKNIQQIKDRETEALKPDSLRQKCQSCLSWAEEIVKKFNTTRQNPKKTTIEEYCIIAAPAGVLNYVLTLMRRETQRLKPKNAKEFRIITCDEPITQRPHLQI